jgi:CubicO group peptidase (beta-lactamase class C family)
MALHGQLQARLDATLESAPRKRVVVAYSTRGIRSLAGSTSEVEPRGADVDWAFPTGCLTKLLCGALLNGVIRQGKLSLADRVATVLEGSDSIECLLDTTIEDLLNHTHGLDDAALSHAPLAENGCIDVDRLLTALSPHRMAAPGEIYSYSNAGAWLLAAVLERIQGTPFANQLRMSLLDPLEATVRTCETSLIPSAPNAICPSIGGTLALSTADMLSFLESEVLARPQEWPPMLEEGSIKPLAGWNALECGIYRGWKHLGEHWFGHNSLWPHASAIVRVQPQLGIAIVIASAYQAAPLIGGKLFGALLPEYKHVSFPKPLAADAVAALDRDLYCGRYTSTVDSLSVHTNVGELALAGSKGEASLVAAARDIFFLRPPAQNGFSFVQFLERKTGGFRYLWDGARVYRRA